MKVGFDLTWMKAGNTFGGVYQYAFRVVSAVVEHTGLDVVAIISPGGEGIFRELKGRKNFTEAVVASSASFLDIVDNQKVDVVHTPLQRFFHCTLSVPMISTLHDLQHLHYPEFFSPEEVKKRDKLYKLSAEVSERVLVTFQHVKDDIVKFYSIPAEKIDVCPVGFDEPKAADAAALADIRKKYGLPERYLFYSANTWRHKNHVSLVKALKILREKYKLDIALISTGQKVASYFPELQKEVERLGLQEHVNFAGYVPEEDVAALLKNASMAVIPTLYEAGSFPLMEAMANGVPVICSNVTSLPDTIGDGRFVFDPNDAEEIAAKIAGILGDEKLLKANRENSKKRVAEGGWDSVAGIFADTYRKAAADFAEKTSGFPSFKQRAISIERLSEEKIRELTAQRDTLLESVSWKITAPLRGMLKKIKK